MSDTIQSAEALAKSFYESSKININKRYRPESGIIKSISEVIEADRAAHIALGRKLERTARAEDAETIAEGDEEAGEANLRNSYDRTRAMHGKNYASVGDAEWDAAVLADEIDRLRAALSRLSAGKVEPK